MRNDVSENDNFTVKNKENKKLNFPFLEVPFDSLEKNYNVP